MRLRAQGVELGFKVNFYGMPIVRMARNSRIYIGDRTVLCSDSRFTALGVNHPVILGTLYPGAEIIIGSECGISGGSICAAVRVELGNECLIGANVTIADSDFHTIQPIGRRFNSNSQEVGSAPIKIASNVFIGTGSIVLKGVCIGQNSIIGAGTIVVKDVASNVVAAGNPAKVLRSL